MKRYKIARAILSDQEIVFVTTWGGTLIDYPKQDGKNHPCLLYVLH
jgi:hypothetical protein